MSRNPKLIVNKTVLLITTRTESGLPFVTNALWNTIIWGVLAKAQTKYPVKICHFVFMANHLHMIAVVDDPEDVPAFMRFVKGETAHAVNKTLGRQKHTVWAEGYDSPILLTAYDVMRYISYIYLNPVRANLVESVEDYPGVSSWKMYKTKIYRKSYKYVSRPQLSRIKLSSDKSYMDAIARGLYRESKEQNDFILEPDAWMGCFDDLEDPTILNSKICKDIKDQEKLLRTQRIRQGKPVVGRARLMKQLPSSDYIPQKHSRKMICICSVKDIRKRFIEFFKELASAAACCYKKKLCYPPGMFAPGGYQHSSLLATCFRY